MSYGYKPQYKYIYIYIYIYTLYTYTTIHTITLGWLSNIPCFGILAPDAMLSLAHVCPSARRSTEDAPHFPKASSHQDGPFCLKRVAMSSLGALCLHYAGTWAPLVLPSSFCFWVLSPDMSLLNPESWTALVFFAESNNRFPRG